MLNINICNASIDPVQKLIFCMKFSFNRYLPIQLFQYQTFEFENFTLQTPPRCLLISFGFACKWSFKVLIWKWNTKRLAQSKRMAILRSSSEMLKGYSVTKGYLSQTEAKGNIQFCCYSRPQHLAPELEHVHIYLSTFQQRK